MILARLSPLEVAAIHAIIEGRSLAALGPDLAEAFVRARRKLSWGTHHNLHPMAEGVTDYGAKWFAAHPEAGRALIERYQLACDRAWGMFWAVREGKS